MFYDKDYHNLISDYKLYYKVKTIVENNLIYISVCMYIYIYIYIYIYYIIFNAILSLSLYIHIYKIIFNDIIYILDNFKRYSLSIDIDIDRGK